MRKTYLLATVAILVVVLAGPALAARYENSRFDYRVDIPGVFDWLPESANGDGRVFRHKTDPRFTITFYARVQQYGDTLAQEGAFRIPPGAADVDETESGNSYYASFTKGGTYTDTLVFLVDRIFYSATASWPLSKNEQFKPLSGEVMRTWKIHGNPTVY